VVEVVNTSKMEKHGRPGFVHQRLSVRKRGQGENPSWRGFIRPRVGREFIIPQFTSWERSPSVVSLGVFTKIVSFSIKACVFWFPFEKPVSESSTSSWVTKIGREGGTIAGESRVAGHVEISGRKIVGLMSARLLGV